MTRGNYVIVLMNNFNFMFPICLKAKTVLNQAFKTTSTPAPDSTFLDHLFLK